MATGTYDDLVADISSWLSDASLAAKAPKFIGYAEARMNRILFGNGSEVTKTATATASMALPDDFREARSIWINSAPITVLAQMEPGELRETWSTLAGIPENYAINSNTLFLGPAPAGAYTVNLVYEQGIPPLTSTAQTNWLIISHPDAYLFGALVHAELHGWNDERLPTLKAAWDEVCNELNALAIRKKYGGPQAMKPQVAV